MRFLQYLRESGLGAEHGFLLLASSLDSSKEVRLILLRPYLLHRTSLIVIVESATSWRGWNFHICRSQKRATVRRFSSTSCPATRSVATLQYFGTSYNLSS